MENAKAFCGETHLEKTRLTVFLVELHRESLFPTSLRQGGNCLLEPESGEMGVFG
jgi:hypothetical protein